MPDERVPWIPVACIAVAILSRFLVSRSLRAAIMEKLWIVEERKDKRMYRRRCAGTDVLTFFFVSSCALLFLLVCSILYGTRTESHTLPPLVREVMPAGRCLCEFSTNFACDTCLDCAANQVVLGQNASEEADNWLYNYKRDRNNYGLDEAQCDSAFPGQYEDIERAVKVRKRWGKVTEADLSSFDLTKGMVRAMVYDREVSNNVTLDPCSWRAC